jgi:hypothetical protein
MARPLGNAGAGRSQPLKEVPLRECARASYSAACAIRLQPITPFAGGPSLNKGWPDPSSLLSTRNARAATGDKNRCTSTTSSRSVWGRST